VNIKAIIKHYQACAKAAKSAISDRCIVERTEHGYYLADGFALLYIGNQDAPAMFKDRGIFPALPQAIGAVMMYGDNHSMTEPHEAPSDDPAHTNRYRLLSQLIESVQADQARLGTTALHMTAYARHSAAHIARQLRADGPMPAEPLELSRLLVEVNTCYADMFDGTAVAMTTASTNPQGTLERAIMVWHADLTGAPAEPRQLLGIVMPIVASNDLARQMLADLILDPSPEARAERSRQRAIDEEADRYTYAVEQYWSAWSRDPHAYRTENAKHRLDESAGKLAALGATLPDDTAAKHAGYRDAYSSARTSYYYNYVTQYGTDHKWAIQQREHATKIRAEAITAGVSPDLLPELTDERPEPIAAD
jgi:hypothetical protein